MKITQSKLRSIIRKTLRESAHAKLNADATNNSANLDQELHFALQNDIIMLCQQYAQHYAEYGVNEQDVLDEIRAAIEDLSLNDMEVMNP